ncbi:hypothetical protein C8R47DRAFT_1070352 [Mycena vitilis]|nr:hypothetical protein C8R47DRAFT_1070352 [Mycena vitilis]
MACLVDSYPPPTRTLQKIHSFVEVQQKGNKLQQFFRQGEMGVLRKDCEVGLEHGLAFFKITNVDLLADKQEADERHSKVLDWLNRRFSYPGELAFGPHFVHMYKQKICH